MLSANQIVRVEVLRVDPLTNRHVSVFGTQLWRHFLHAFFVHQVQQSTDEVSHEIDSKCPARSEIAKDPRQVRNTGEHHPPIRHCLGPINRFAIYFERDVTKNAEIETGCRDDDVGIDHRSIFRHHSGFGECLDFISHHRCFAGFDSLEQIAVGHESDALLPRSIARGEMRIDVVVLGKMLFDSREQLFFHQVGMGHTQVGDHLLIEKNLATNNFMNPGFVDLQLSQHVSNFVGVASHRKIRG